MNLRNALTALKGPLGNIPKFRKKIESLLGDEGARERLMSELGMGDEGGGRVSAASCTTFTDQRRQA
jgi:type VI secretion system protein ImpB